MAGDAKKRPRRSRLGLFARGMLWLSAVLAILAAAAGFGVFLIYDHITQPGVMGTPVDVIIPEGATGKGIGNLLTDLGLVEHEVLFRAAIRLDGKGGPIKHGQYTLHRGQSPTEILQRLYEGPNKAFDPSTLPPDQIVTIPEGLTIKQAAEIFDDPAAFAAAAADPAYLDRLGLETATLEGFLMPNTYYFEKKPSPPEVVERMIAQFQAEYAALMVEFPDAEIKDPLRAVTIASLVEEEAKTDAERPTIASVIYNRIERNMTLDMDSTLQFALGKYGQRMLDEDKEVDSPYNTYRNAGLPPGPISNPGAASLRAALHPAETDLLYFVSNADGKTHTFSRTLQEHNSAVARYRREMREQRAPLQ